MTLISNVFTQYDAYGNREDLTDFIYDVSPTDTPFISSIPKTAATAVLHEWQTDSLASASATNQQLEGDSISAASSSATTRLGNRCQISYKALGVSGTQEAILKAGRKSELKYQILKRSKELKRDMEASLLANNAAVTGATGSARELGGIEAWFTTNVSRGTGGSSGSLGTSAASNGTQRTFTESLVKAVLVSCFSNGGDPDTIMLSPEHKQTFSGFTGNATRFKTAEDKRLTATIDVYQSDFGDMQVMPNRFMQGFSGATTSGIRSALVLQTDMWALATLRPPQLQDLAKVGDAERRFVIAEYTLESRNQAASGIVADLS